MSAPQRIEQFERVARLDEDIAAAWKGPITGTPGDLMELLALLVQEVRGVRKAVQSVESWMEGVHTELQNLEMNTRKQR